MKDFSGKKPKEKKKDDKKSKLKNLAGASHTYRNDRSEESKVSRDKVVGASRWIESGKSADRKDSTGSLKWGRVGLYGVALSLVVYFLMSVNWHETIERAERVAHRPVSNVIIEGEFNFISKEKVQALITGELNGDFVEMNLNVIKQAIELSPWVESVVIQRIWPDNLKVTIAEHKPIARWSNNGFISREGELIKVDSNTNLKELPMLSGDEAKSRDVARNYLLVSKLLGRSDLSVSGLAVDSKMSWRVELDGKFYLVLGQEEIQEKLEEFILVYEKYLQNSKDAIQIIDMRYQKGLAVQWRENANLLAVQSEDVGQQNVGVK
ncbi:MAG: cell division protein FtsQ [Lentisphaeria bacterium]|jgi:cell division protein FtsQ